MPVPTPTPVPAPGVVPAGAPAPVPGAAALLARLRDGTTGAVEAVQACLARIGAVDPQVGAVTEVLARQALAEAARLDAHRAAGHAPGPLAGLPFTVKANVDVAGSPTTEGVVAHRDRVPALDAPVVAALRRAGAVPVARTNMPEFGLRWHTVNELHGATLNPFDATVSPSGSSGGEAVALALGMSPLGIGNDLGGSLRLPAAEAGVAGLKPTPGRVAAASAWGAPVQPTAQLFSVTGPLAPTVADLAAVWPHLCGPDPRDPRWVPVPPWHGDEAPVRVGFTADVADGTTAPAAREAVLAAARALAGAGVQVGPAATPAVSEAAWTWRRLVAADLAGFVAGPMRRLVARACADYVEDSFRHVPRLDRDGYAADLARRHDLRRRWAEVLEEHPVLLVPVSAAPHTTVGADLHGPDAADALWWDNRLVVALNLLGLPALCVPVGCDDAGLPVGVQLVGRPHHEAQLLRVGRTLEEQLHP